MLESDTSIELTWEILPSGWRCVADARKQTIDQLVSAIAVVVDSVWAGQLPESMVHKAREQVAIGVRKAVAILTLRNKPRWGTIGIVLGT